MVGKAAEKVSGGREQTACKRGQRHVDVQATCVLCRLRRNASWLPELYAMRVLQTRAAAIHVSE